MSPQESSRTQGNFEGQKLLYTQPELLTLEEHGKLGINPSAQAFEFVRSALATRPDDQFAVVMDRAAEIISENAEEPFFEGKGLSAPVQARVDFCVQFDAQLQSTAAFCDQLAAAKLLSGQEATFKPDDGGEEKPVATYVAVEMKKLTELDSETAAHKKGTLGAIYAHRFSLDNWIRLLERNMLRRRDD